MDLPLSIAGLLTTLKGQLIDYKNAAFLRHFLTERGKILPSRISGACCLHQRQLAHAIKKHDIGIVAILCILIDMMFGS